MISVTASITVKPGKVREFLQLFKANVPNVKAEEGCIEYFPAGDVISGIPAQKLNPNMVTILEKWESLEALKAHLAAPHMAAYRAQVKDIVEDTVLKVLEEV